MPGRRRTSETHIAVRQSQPGTLIRTRCSTATEAWPQPRREDQHDPRQAPARARGLALGRPFPALPARVLDDRVRAREYPGRVAVIESHQVGRLPARPADLYDLAFPLRVANDVGAQVEPVPDGCLHATTSLSRRV